MNTMDPADFAAYHCPAGAIVLGDRRLRVAAIP
jgi:hypothetical protein